MRNPTPTLIALFCAFVIATFGAGVTWIVTHHINVAIFLFGLLCLVSFIIVYYSVELFLYRKIKLIYKSIHDFRIERKGNTLIKAIDIDSNPVSDVNEEVIDWMKRSSLEIEELERQEQFRKEFLGNVSHELKTPIFNLQGYIHTLLDGALHDPEVNVKFLEKAARSADRMSALVQDLISISQIETGQLKMEIEKFDINELTKDVFEQLEVRAKKKNIELKIKDGCDISFWVEGDKNRIRQVLLNLIINGIIHGKEGGYVGVAYYDMGENILTEVADNADGIEKEYLPRLFERFYRVDKSRSRDEGGTGLGLAIVKHIVEAHNQTINVRSSVGVGTTFGFTLKRVD